MKIKRWHIITTLSVIIAALFSLLKYLGVVSEVYLFPGLFSVFMVIAAFVYFLPLRDDRKDRDRQ